jgi:PAS domain S-box-containing protein
LLDHENLSTVLWEHCLLGLAEVGLNGEWLKVNPCLCNILEYTQSELERKTFQDVTHPDDVNDDVDMVRRVATGNLEEYVMSKRYITKTGKVIWIKLKVNPITKDGKVVRFLSQIAPAKSMGTVSPDPSQPTVKSFTAKDFLVKNWKWCASVAFGVVVVLATEYHKWQSMQERMNKVEQMLVDMKKATSPLEEMVKKFIGDQDKKK